jgi:CheY-like chemotaxis protein
LNVGLQSNARLATNVPKNLATHEDSIAKLIYDNDLSGSTPSSTEEKLDPKEWHILIVEDNLVNQRVLAEQIRKLGCTVHVANHGEEALQLLRQTKHFKEKEADGKDLSVILMDLEMPVMDGLTCVRRIREMEAEGLMRTRLPIIAVTANARGEQIAAAKDSGMVSDVFPRLLLSYEGSSMYEMKC